MSENIVRISDILLSKNNHQPVCHQPVKKKCAVSATMAILSTNSYNFTTMWSCDVKIVFSSTSKLLWSKYENEKKLFTEID